MEDTMASEVRDEFAEVINRVALHGERVIIRRQGKDLVAVIPLEDLRLLERLEAAEEERIDLAAVQKILADPTEERIRWEQIKAERQRRGDD